MNISSVLYIQMAFVHKMTFLLCSVLTLTTVLAQIEDETVSPYVLDQIFRRPPSDPPSIKRDRDGNPCQCVPFYQCDPKTHTITNNADYQDFETFDERHDPTLCNEIGEICCKIPQSVEKTPIITAAPQHRGCGYSNPLGVDSSTSAKIFNLKSNEAQLGEFPWAVALLDPANNSYHGMGILIHQQVVMTAAHVVKHIPIKHLMVRAGEWDITNKTKPLPVQQRKIVVKRIRDGFVGDAEHVANDIALLGLDEPIQLADHVNVICLPDQDESFDGYKDCITNGWGRDVYGNPPKILKKIKMNMVTKSNCHQQLKDWIESGNELHSSVGCAIATAEENMCQGLGGAPLACPIGDNRYKLSGLVVAGVGCDHVYPGLHTQVSRFRDWIDTILDEWGLNTSGAQVPHKKIIFRQGK